MFTPITTSTNIAASLSPKTASQVLRHKKFLSTLALILSVISNGFYSGLILPNSDDSGPFSTPYLICTFKLKIF